MTDPRLSVAMSVHNGVPYVGAAVESIIAQSFRDFEFLILDDGSTDGSGDALRRIASGDLRVRVLQQSREGLTRALIRGCAEARAELIARHDCGDRSHRSRLEKQRALFDDRDVVLASCFVRTFAPGGELLYTTEADGEAIRRSLLADDVDHIRALPHHGSAMFRRDAYEAAGGYRPQFYFAQDVDLWMRMARIGKIAVVSGVLYDATISTSAISSRNRAEQIASARLSIAIRDGGDEAALLARAAEIRPQRGRGGAVSDARALYFIASCLRRNRDRAWRRYARAALLRMIGVRA
jgi:glycosyltransferase involved in cell wall biosynthesis